MPTLTIKIDCEECPQNMGELENALQRELNATSEGFTVFSCEYSETTLPEIELFLSDSVLSA